MSLLFVYGTLKRGCSNHHYLAGQAFVGEVCTAAGFRLYDLGGYPGMVACGGEQEGVFGEVWSVDEECLRRLDRLEGLAEGLYRRVSVPLLAPFSDRVIEAYLYPKDVAGRCEVGTNWTE